MSPKMGRPVSGDERKNTTVRLRMEPQEIQQLDEIAERLETTRSGAIREALKHLKEKLDKEKDLP